MREKKERRLEENMNSGNDKRKGGWLMDDEIDEKRRVLFSWFLIFVSLYPLTLDHTVSFLWVVFLFVSSIVMMYDQLQFKVLN